MIVREKEITEHLLRIYKFGKGLLAHDTVAVDFSADTDTFIVCPPWGDGNSFTLTRKRNVCFGIVVNEI